MEIIGLEERRLSSQDQSIDLVYEGEMFIPGQKGTSDVHATGANPDIIDGYFVPFLLQGTINQAVLSGHLRGHPDYFNPQPGDDPAEFPFVE
jgi:hypothetical protein